MEFETIDGEVLLTVTFAGLLSGWNYSSLNGKARYWPPFNLFILPLRHSQLLLDWSH